MGYITSILSGILGGVGYAVVGYLASAQKESFNLPKFITTVVTGAISGLSSSLIGIQADPIVLAAASAGVTASTQKFVKAVIPIEVTPTPVKSQEEKIKNREGSATKMITNWDGNPLQILYLSSVGSVHIGTRKALNADEAEVARQSNVARCYEDGIMTDDQVKQAGYDPNQLLPHFRLIWEAQAKELELLKKSP